MQEPHSETESVEFEVKPKLANGRGRRITQAVVGIGALAIISLLAAMLARGAATPSVDPTTRVMPAGTVLYVSMTTHPERQPNYAVVADAWSGSREAKQIESGLQLALATAGFNWDEDIRPWLGDRVALGLADFGGADEPAGGDALRYRMPFVVVAAQTLDRQKSDAFLAAYRKQQADRRGTSATFKDDTYRGVPFVYVENDSQYSPYGEAYATIDDVVVLTTGPDNLKKVIDAALDGANLAASENFQKTMAALPGATVGAAYADYGRYMESISAMMEGVGLAGGQEADLLRKQMDQAREMMQALGGAGVAMGYEPGGIRFDVAMQFDPAGLPEDMRAVYNLDIPTPSRLIFDAIPASAIVAYGGANLTAGWKALLDNPDWLNLSFGRMLGPDGDVAGWIAAFEERSGVDLAADLFDLLNGEMAFVVLPKSVLGDSVQLLSLPFDLALMLDASDPARVESSVTRLLQALEPPESSFMQVQPLSGLPYTTLVAQDLGVILTYGVVDGRFVVGSTSSTLLAIDNAGQAPLSADATFKLATAALPANRLQTGYVQLTPLWDWFERLSQSSGQDCGPCNYLRPFKWMTLASEPPDAASGLMRGEFHLAIEAPPSPNPSGN